MVEGVKIPKFYYNRPGQPAHCIICGKDLGYITPDEDDFSPEDEIDYCDECFDDEENWWTGQGKVNE